MALLSINYFSSSLQNTIDLNVIIPTPEGNEQITDQKVKDAYRYEEGLPVVYLLHGAFGNYSSWVRFSNIERYAQKYGCAVVMPSAENSFYQDMWHGKNYYTFLSKELPAFVTSVFPISKKREKTYIAGLSMGGYGAWFLALSNPELYAKSASLSGALDIVKLFNDIKNGETEGPFEWEAIFKDPSSIEGTQADLVHLFNHCKKQGTTPELYQACGKDDFLFTMNQSIRDRFIEAGANLTYEEGDGDHNWDFWDHSIQNVLKWLFD